MHIDSIDFFSKQLLTLRAGFWRLSVYVNSSMCGEPLLSYVFGHVAGFTIQGYFSLASVLRYASSVSVNFLFVVQNDWNLQITKVILI